MVLGFGSSKNKASDDEAPSANDVDQLSMKNLESSEKSQFKEFKEFLKTVISFTGDLSSLTCPAFFLNGLSLLEYGYILIFNALFCIFNFIFNVALIGEITLQVSQPSMRLKHQKVNEKILLIG